MRDIYVLFVGPHGESAPGRAKAKKCIFLDIRLDKYPREVYSLVMSPSLQQEIGKRRPFDTPEEEAFINLLRTAWAVSGEVNRVYSQHDLTASQYYVLRILRGHRPEVLSCGEIMQDMVTRDSDVTRILDHLEKAGFVSRQRCTSDRRVVRSKITPQGLSMLKQMDRPVVDAVVRELGHLGEKRLKQLSSLLQAARDRREG